MKSKLHYLILLAIVLLVPIFQNGCSQGGSSSSEDPVITNINGGVAGSGTVGSLFIINGTGFGNLSKAASGYSVNFRNASTNALVATAAVNYSTADWTNIYIKATVPNGLTAGTTYKVDVTNPGGTSNPVNFLIAASVSFSPSTILWSTTSSLPQARQGFPTVINAIGNTNYIYALGGNTASASTSNGKKSNTATVYYNQMNNSTGALSGGWASTTSLPGARGFSAGVAANKYNSQVNTDGVIYVLGGLDSNGSATNTVYYGAIAADGKISSWGTTTSLPQALYAHSAIIFLGRIYVVGGNSSSGSPQKTVYSAVIRSDGKLESWKTLNSLPAARAYHQLVTFAGYLYVLGGAGGAVDPLTNSQSASSQKTVYYNWINFVNGSLISSNWANNTSTMNKEREKHTAVVAGSDIVVSGGLYSGSPGNSENIYASINSDGSVGSFNGATGSNTISDLGHDLYNHSTAYFVDQSGKPHILILGGADVSSGLPQVAVYYQH